MNNREFISALASKMGMNVGDTQKMMNDTIDEMVNQFDENWLKRKRFSWLVLVRLRLRNAMSVSL